MQPQVPPAAVVAAHSGATTTQGVRSGEALSMCPIHAVSVLCTRHRSAVWAVPPVSQGLHTAEVAMQHIGTSTFPPSHHPTIPHSPGGKRVVVKPLSFTTPAAPLGAVAHAAVPSSPPVAGSPSQTGREPFSERASAPGPNSSSFNDSTSCLSLSLSCGHDT